MAKRTRSIDWYQVLIKKVGTDTILGKEFWEKVDETNKEFGLPKLPRGSRGTVINRLKKTGLFEEVKEGRSMLYSITDTDKLLEKIFKGEKHCKPKRAKKADVIPPVEIKKIVEEKPVDPERDSFVKYFRCLRYSVRMHKKVISLKTCMEVALIKRIAASHVLHWAKVTKNLGIDITFPIVHRGDSEITIEFSNNYEEDLLKMCLFGHTLYPDYKSLNPADAFGSEIKVKQLQQQLERKKEIKKEIEVKKISDTKKPSISGTERKRLIFLVAGKLFEGGYQTLEQIKNFLSEYGINLTKGEIRDILNTCPEINAIKDESDKVYLRGLMRGETEKQFWNSIRDSYGPKFNEKEEILCRISMTKREVAEYLSSKTTEISVASRYNDHDNIFRITVAKNSRVDEDNLISLIRCFRREDVVLTHSAYTENLFKRMKEIDKQLKASDFLWRCETGFFQK